MDSSVAPACCQDADDGVPVKNTFIHFVTANRRSLRLCHSAPADPALPTITNTQICGEQEEHVEMRICEDAETSTACSDIDAMSIQTPDMTPRRLDSPGDSRPASLMSTPRDPLAPNSATDACREKSPCYGETFASPVYLQLSSDPAIAFSTFKFTLRLAEKGAIGIELAESKHRSSLVVRGILAGLAVDSWNQQCMVGSAANMARCVSIGDELVCVNDKEGCREMLLECQERMLLKLTFARKDPSFTLPSLERI